MKYSVRGNLPISDGSAIVSTINGYVLWRLITEQSTDEEGNPIFTFESWLNTPTDKDSLYDQIKPFVDTYTGVIDWHECSHDEIIHQPCVIAESYER